MGAFQLFRLKKNDNVSFFFYQNHLRLNAALRAFLGIHQLAASGKFYFMLRWIFSP